MSIYLKESTIIIMDGTQLLASQSKTTPVTPTTVASTTSSLESLLQAQFYQTYPCIPPPVVSSSNQVADFFSFLSTPSSKSVESPTLFSNYLPMTAQSTLSKPFTEEQNEFYNSMSASFVGRLASNYFYSLPIIFI